MIPNELIIPTEDLVVPFETVRCRKSHPEIGYTSINVPKERCMDRRNNEPVAMV
jgi:hypothetical protein